VPPAARDGYISRLNTRRAELEAMTAADARVAYARLATFLSGVLLAAVLWLAAFSPWWTVAPVAMFVLLVRRHDAVLRARDRAAPGIAFYERGLARLEDRWIGTGDPGERFRNDGRNALPPQDGPSPSRWYGSCTRSTAILLGQGCDRTPDSCRHV